MPAFGGLIAAVRDLQKTVTDFKAASQLGKVGMAAKGAALSTQTAGQLPTAAITALADVAGRVVGVFDRLGSSVGRFVEASNPAEMIRFNIAVKDLSAAFGKVFEPVILVATEFANILNQFVTSLQPVLGPLVQTLADAFLQIAKAVLDAVAPIIESLIPVFQMLADFILPPIITVFRALSDAIRAVINWIRSWLGMSPLAEGRASERGGPRTVAAQRASQIGIEQIGEQARASAFGGAGTAERQLDEQQRANQLLLEQVQSLRLILTQLRANGSPATGTIEAALRGYLNIFGTNESRRALSGAT